MTLFIDASAIVALIAGEEGADVLAHRIDDDPDRITSPIARWEAVVALHRSRDYDWRYAQNSVDAFFHNRNVRTVSIGEGEGQYALSVFGNYGKGKHPARLNMGDCFAYACAELNDARILYKGDDFAQTEQAWLTPDVLDIVELTQEFQGHPVGRRGTVVMQFADKACEVEFDDGETRSVPLHLMKLIWKAPRERNPAS